MSRKKVHVHKIAYTHLVIIIMLLTGCTTTITNVPAIPSNTVAKNITSTFLLPTETKAPTQTPASTKTLTPTPTIIPSETPTPFVPIGTIKIGAQVPLSGNYANYGTTILSGVELAISQLVGPLMELGYKVELVTYDDESDYGVAIETAQQIVDDPEVLCTVGPFASRFVNEVKEIYHQAGLAFISPSATAAFVSESGYLEVNRVVGRHDGQGIAGALFAKSEGIQSVFVISQSSDYGQFNAYNFMNEAKRLEISIAGNVTTEDSEKFGNLVDQVMVSGAEMVYFSTLVVEQAGTFFREARAAGYTGTFLGVEEMGSPSLVETAGPLITDGGGVFFTLIAAPAIYYPGSTQFIKDYQLAYQAEPQTFAAQAYDAAGICLKAIENVVKDGGLPGRTEVAMAIRALVDYPGITGIINFNAFGDPDPAQYFVVQVVSPDPNDWSQNKLVTTYELAPPN